MSPDPLMPAVQRFPMNPLYVPICTDPPSRVQPFVLQGITPTPAATVEAKHRTPTTQRTIPRQTNLDNMVVDDSYTVPDD